MRQTTSHSARGFTLIELLITIAIVGILAAIAIPSYRDQVLKTGRSDGKVALMSAAQALERCYTQTSTYVGCPTPTIPPATPTTSSEGRYRVTFTAGPTATTYTVTATPVVGGPQAGDAKCATLSINQAGSRTATGTDAANCW